MVFLIRTIKEKKMKKNFLMVAALLIAAMLLVVSCTQEVAPVDNNLVEVTLNTSTARSVLQYTGYGDSISYEYKLTAQWHPEKVSDNKADAVVGETTGFLPFESDSDPTVQGLGYLSQGLWEVEVNGKVGEDIVLNGKTQVYINKNNNKVNVFVEPVSEENNARISLSVNVNDHEAIKETGNKYKLVYSIEDVGGNFASGTVGSETKNQINGLDMSAGSSLGNNGFREWTATVTNMKPGYYRVTVTMMNGDDKVGGITQGVLLFANDTTAKLSGYVNSSDFINGTLNVYYPSVSVEFGVPTITEEKHAFVKGSAEEDSYKVTYTATPKITGDNSKGGIPTCTWYADGVKVTGENASSTYTAYYKKTEPGYKTVTCVVKYTFSVTDDANNTVEYVVQGSGDKTTKVPASQN